MWLAAVLAGLGYNQCVDERAPPRPYDAPVCEEGFSLEYELGADPNAPPVRRKRVLRINRRTAPILPPPVPDTTPLEEPGEELPPREPVGPYLRVGESSAPTLTVEPMSPLQVSYVRAEYELPEVVPDEELGDFEIDDGPDWYSEAWHSHDRALNVHLAQTMHPGRLQMVIQHRTINGFLDNTARDFAGFDNGLKIGLGLRLGVIDGVDVGLLRVNGVGEPFDVYEYDIKLRAVEYEGFATGLRFGLTTFYEAAKGTSSGWFLRLGLEKILLDRVLVAVNTSYHSDSSSPAKRDDDIDATCNVGGAMEVRIADWVSISGDVMVALVGFKYKFPAWAIGPKFWSNRHTFSVVIANTPQVSFDGLIVNSPRSELRELLLGFNVTREFDLWGDDG